MVKVMRRVLVAALSLFLMPLSARSAEIFSDHGIEVTGDVSYFTQYVWRGMILDRDDVLQPGFYVSNQDKGFGKLSLKWWSSHDLENEDNLHSEENDYIIDYTYTLAGIGLSVGHTYYDFVETSTHSKEWYAGITLPAYTCSLSAIKGTTVCPSFYVYRDYGHPADGGGEGTYTVVNLATSTPVAVGQYSCSLDLAGHYGWNHEDFIAGDGSDLGIQAAFTVPATPNLTMSPNVNYSIPYGDLKKADDGNQKKRLYYGVTARYKF